MTRTRPANLQDAEAIARIYDEGITDRVATFETEPRTTDDIARGLSERAPRWPTVVVERDGRGVWKLLSRVFPENEASRRLLARVGFREVGRYRGHAKLDGEWRETVIVERLIGEARR